MHPANVAGLSHQPRDPQAKIRTVDGDHDVGLPGQHGVSTFANTAFQVKILWQNFGNAHDREFIHGKLTRQPLIRHQRPSDPAKLDFALIERLEARHQSSA